MIIDGHIIITGSFNFTKAAQEKNAENVLIIDSNKLAEIYTKYWNERLKQSIPVKEYRQRKEPKS
jgi:phosphatidylserine/phosphatidylglycerophosphate/cardiolipin synthase-like enzyme